MHLCADYFVWDNVTVDGKPAYISRANDAAITGTNYYNVLYKGPTNGWTSKQQTESVDKGSLALISGEIFQASLLSTVTLSHAKKAAPTAVSGFALSTK